MDESVFSFKAAFSCRNFVGHRSGKKVSEIDIMGNEVNEIISTIWEAGKSHIKREVVIADDSVSWHTDLSPTIESIDKFMIIQNKDYRRNYFPSKLNIDSLRELRNREINILVHVYSTSVSSQAVWNDVKKKLIDPENRDRAGAHNTQTQVQLVEKLKQIHGEHLSAQEITWMCWANYIQAAPAHKQAEMSEQLPPPHLYTLFQTVPSREASLLANIQRHNRIAENINEGNKQLLRNLRVAVDKLKVLVQDIDLRLQVVEERCEINDGLLNAVDNTLNPCEDEFSLMIEETVDDQIDVDHTEE